MIERLASGSDSLVVEVASNDGYLLQHFLPHGHPGARRRAGAERGGGRGRARRRDADGVLRRGARPAAGGGARHGRPRPRKQRARPSARTSTTSSPGVAALLAPDGDGDVRVPAPREADRAPRVRHDLPRALLVLLAALDPLDLRRAGARTSSTSRSFRATEARSACSCSTPRRASSRRAAVADAPRAGGRAGHARPGDLRAVRRGSARVEARAPRAADRPSPRGQARRRLRRARQGQHAPQLLRHPDGLPRLHRRPEPVQAGQAHPGDAHPDPPARADRRDAART